MKVRARSKGKKFYYNILIKGTRFFWIFLLFGILMTAVLLLCMEMDGTELIRLIWQ